LGRKISIAQHRFLKDESSKWVDDGVISAETRDGILSGYTSARKLPVVIWALGLSMIGLGILSFIAANWEALGRLLKIVLIVGLYAVSVAAAYFYERRGRKTASELLLFMSGFLLLGGIALMSQVFHISGTVEGLLVTWLIVYLPTFLIVRNLMIFILYEIVTLFYLNVAFVNDNNYHKYYGGETSAAFSVGPVGPLLLLVLLVGVAWRMWSERRKLSIRSTEPWIKYVFIGGATRRIFFSNFLILNWFTWICAINSRYSAMWPCVLGVLAVGACIIFAGGRLDAADLEWQGLLIVGAAGMSLTFEFVWDDFGHYGHLNDYSVTILASVMLGAYLVSRIIRRQRGSGFSTFLFCALLARWYFDVFYSFMRTSIFFISGGVFLLFIAFAYRKWNKLAGEKPGAENGGGGDENTW
jgi:uncharacterized membrane protein